MKRKLFLLCSLAACLAACQKENMATAPEEPSQKERSVIYVSTEGADATKASFNGTRQVWEEGDRIVVYRVKTNDTPVPEYFKYSTTLDDGKAAFVAEADDATGTKMDYTYALYPADNAKIVLSYADPSFAMLFTKLPSTQAYKADSFDPAANVMWARSEDRSNVSFSNGMGYLKISLKGDGAKIKRLTLTSLAAEGETSIQPLWYEDAILTPPSPQYVFSNKAVNQFAPSSAEANLTLDCGEGVTISSDKATDFIFTLPAAEYANGFKLRFETVDGHSVARKIGATTIERSAMLPLPELNVGKLLGTTTIIEYTGESSASGNTGVLGDFLDYFDDTTKKGKLLGYGGVTRIVDSAEEADVNNGIYYLPAAGNNAFTSVTIGGSVTSIEGFSGCKALRSVSAQGVTTLGAGTFKDCTALQYADFNNLKTIGDKAFSGCSSLSRITGVDNLETIGASAFYTCYSLDLSNSGSIVSGTAADGYTITLPNVTSIGNSAFERCNSLFKDCSNFIMPKVKTIGEKAFRKLESDNSTTSPNSLYLKSIEMIGASAFEYMPNLKLVRIGSSCGYIGVKAFWDCAMSKDGTWDSTTGPADNNSGFIIDAVEAPEMTFTASTSDWFSNQVFVYCPADAEDSYSAWTVDSKIKIWPVEGLSNLYWK